MPSNQISDSEVISRCLDFEDGPSWELFVRRYSKLIWSSIHKVLRTASFRYTLEDAEDVYSGIFLSLLQNDCRKLRQFQARNGCKLSTWLSVVAVRATIDFVRQQNRQAQHTLNEDELAFDSLQEPKPNIEAALLEMEQRTAFEQALHALPESDRQLLHLQQSENLTPADAARKLGISVTAFYTRKHRLTERLKKMSEV